MDTQKIASIITDLEVFNRLYAEAREYDKYNLVDYFQEHISDLRNELIALGIPLKLKD